MAVCFGRCIFSFDSTQSWRNCILILVIGSVLIFSASIHAKFSVIAAGIVVASAALLSKIIIFLGDHQYLPHFFAHVYDRLVVLKNPFLSFHDRGFQPSMVYLAMYNGGFWGTGLANGMVKKVACQKVKPILSLR